MPNKQNTKNSESVSVSSARPRRRVIKGDYVLTLKLSEIRQARKAYALKILQMLEVDYATKRKKYVSKQQIEKLKQKIS